MSIGDGLTHIADAAFLLLVLWVCLIATTRHGRQFSPRTLRQQYRDLPEEIIADLAELCFAGVSPFADTDRQTCVNIGRQQVWLHVNKFLGLKQSEIEELYMGRGIQIGTEEDENVE